MKTKIRNAVAKLFNKRLARFINDENTPEVWTKIGEAVGDIMLDELFPKKGGHMAKSTKKVTKKAKKSNKK